MIKAKGCNIDWPAHNKDPERKYIVHGGKLVTAFSYRVINEPEYMVQSIGTEYYLGWSLQQGYRSNPTTPKLQHTSNQEQYDQCGNSTE